MSKLEIIELLKQHISPTPDGYVKLTGKITVHEMDEILHYIMDGDQIDTKEQIRK